TSVSQPPSHNHRLSCSRSQQPPSRCSLGVRWCDKLRQSRDTTMVTDAGFVTSGESLCCPLR
ncbi:hypothetical protein A2U01_0116816, partial [Trifolium medium]|nr:hypothetical protein [Trifolium medium]